MKVTILGCGGSGGVPLAGRVAGGTWGACDPAEPRNRRRRVSILVEEGGSAILVDTSPDLRVQMLDADITQLDAVLFTHAHGDHCHGIDELRTLVFGRGSAIPAYMDPITRDRLTRRFDYAFSSTQDPNSLYAPLLEDYAVEGPFAVNGLEVVPFVQDHGAGEITLGYRIGDLAYSTDVVRLDEAAFAVLEGVQLWIVDALREDPHPTHSHIDQTLTWIERVKPARALLTHMNHTVDYASLAARCPPGVAPAHDGLTVEL
ncbi:MAG: MBL fold metallo-hydrolase [Pseudomonadota bacterium]